MNAEQKITTKRNFDPFSWLPNYLVNDPNVSSEALSAALYLHGKPHDWQTRPFDVRNRFGWGDHTWRKVSKELRDLGLLHENVTKNGRELWFGFNEDDLTFRRSDKKATRRFSQVAKTLPLEIDALNKKDTTNKEITNKNETLCKPANNQNKQKNEPQQSPPFVRSFLKSFNNLVPEVDAQRWLKKYGKEKMLIAISVFDSYHKKPKNVPAFIEKCLSEGWKPSQTSHNQPQSPVQAIKDETRQIVLPEKERVSKLLKMGMSELKKFIDFVKTRDRYFDVRLTKQGLDSGDLEAIRKNLITQSFLISYMD